MLKMVTITECKCELCESIVSASDKFCSECGNNLTENIIYEEYTKQMKKDRDEYFRMRGIAP